MSRYFFFLFFLFLGYSGLSQISLSGQWRGAVIRAGSQLDNATLLYVNFEVNGNDISGGTREEIYESDLYALKQIDGKIIGDNISFRQIVIEKSSKSSKIKWCRFSCNLQYNEKTGYLEGDYESTDCKRVIGKIILYRVLDNETKEPITEGFSQQWFEIFNQDIKDELSAPEVRKKERDNFVFKPVYFDYDKSDILPEYTQFLDNLIKIVKGHSDLRIKVTGNTDSDGSDQYNDALSKRRAEAIINYFVSKGLKADRLEFEFKGEKNPVDTNATPEGKQRNRRVDFKFI